MATRRRPLTQAQQHWVWKRWVAGESLDAIAAALTVSASGAYGVIEATGGIRPAPRCRARTALTLADREVIARGVARQESCHAIGRTLGRAPSTISRESARHGHRTAQHSAVVARLLGRQWSPAQIAGWLVTEYAEDPTMRVSEETIYQSLYVQARADANRAGAARLSGRSRSPSARPSSRTARFPAIGKATCWPAVRTRISRPWSSGHRDVSCS
jgi:IS30 family transposase